MPLHFIFNDIFSAKSLIHLCRPQKFLLLKLFTVGYTVIYVQNLININNCDNKKKKSTLRLIERLMIFFLSLIDSLCQIREELNSRIMLDLPNCVTCYFNEQ